MITNDKQLALSRKWLAKFKNDAALAQINLSAIYSQIEEIEDDIREYIYSQIEEIEDDIREYESKPSPPLPGTK